MSSCDRWFLPEHKWEKWEVIEQGNVLHYGEKKGKYYEMKRTCSDCGKIELKELRTDK